MAGDKMRETILKSLTPHTYNALTWLVMAMENAAKDAGKKTFFGQDKGEKYAKFLKTLKETINAMILDGVVRESTKSDKAVQALTGKLMEFAEAHPNWPIAYSFAFKFFINSEQDAIAVIERLRSLP